MRHLNRRWWAAGAALLSMLSGCDSVPTESEALDKSASALTSVELTARRYYKPSRWQHGTQKLPGLFSFQVPGELPVTVGNAGNHTSTLRFRDCANHVDVRCTYRGGASQASPSSPEQVELGRRYVLDSCVRSDGAPGPVAGEVMRADYFKLSVGSGDRRAPSGPSPMTEVRLSLKDASCRDVQRVDDYTFSFSASGALASQQQVARWVYRAQPSLGAELSYQVTGLRADGQPQLYGSLVVDPRPQEGSTALSYTRSFLRLDAEPLSEETQHALWDAVAADQPRPECLAAALSAPAAASAPATRLLDERGASLGQVSASLATAPGEGATCETQGRALFDASVRLLPAIVAHLGEGRFQELLRIMEQWAGLNAEYNCCSGRDTSWPGKSGQPWTDCSCEARFPERPLLSTYLPEGAGDVSFRTQYVCESCPAGQTWNSTQQQCEDCAASAPPGINPSVWCACGQDALLPGVVDETCIPRTERPTCSNGWVCLDVTTSYTTTSNTGSPPESDTRERTIVLPMPKIAAQDGSGGLIDDPRGWLSLPTSISPASGSVWHHSADGGVCGISEDESGNPLPYTDGSIRNEDGQEVAYSFVNPCWAGLADLPGTRSSHYMSVFGALTESTTTARGQPYWCSCSE